MCNRRGAVIAGANGVAKGEASAECERRRRRRRLHARAALAFALVGGAGGRPRRQAEVGQRCVEARL